MERLLRRFALVVALSLVGLSALAATANAHGGPGFGLRSTSATALVREAAEQLDVTAARLTTAIENAAVARINEAVEDGDVDSDDAEDLREEARENLGFALSVSRTRTVASNLGINTTRLNTAFRAARRAVILERINDAVEDGDLDDDEAAELREELEDADLPGYHAGFGGRGFGLGFRPGGFRFRG
jgi:hypothetical protein